MTKYIAFLRVINVGGHTVKMDQLKKLFESLELSNVETFIASGNVIFEANIKNASTLEKKIADYLEKELGYGVDTFVRTIQEVIEIEKQCPFTPKKKDDNVYISFLHETLDKEKTDTLRALKNKNNNFALIGKEIYWLRLNRDDSIFLKSSLEKLLKVSSTNRNITTINKIIQKYE